VGSNNETKFTLDIVMGRKDMGEIITHERITRGCIQKFPDRVDNEINNNKSLRSKSKGYGGKTH
jgi:hypothetical protein